MLLEVTDTPEGKETDRISSAQLPDPSPWEEETCALFLATALQGNSGLFFQPQVSPEG